MKKYLYLYVLLCMFFFYQYLISYKKIELLCILSGSLSTLFSTLFVSYFKPNHKDDFLKIMYGDLF